VPLSGPHARVRAVRENQGDPTRPFDRLYEPRRRHGFRAGEAGRREDRRPISGRFNPFARDNREEVTPRFLDEAEKIPEGRLSLGEALVAPNLFPHERYSAVTILSEAGFVPLSGFSEDLLVNAFRAYFRYLERARETNSEELRHYSANWSYMPLSGGSVVHPHHQLVASPIPTNYLWEVEASLSRYGREYFGDPVSLEEGGERWMGRQGGISWLTGFAPLGHIDVVGAFAGRYSIFDLADEDVRALGRSLLRIFVYLEEEDLASLNFALYRLEGAGGFIVHCRLSPRFLLSNALRISEVNYFEFLHAEPLAFFYPKAPARSLRERFEDAERGDPR
jgi:UDPglucose--hexose-1-phosphate uridylyltransferase